MANRRRARREPRPAPALLCGTSSEYLGQRALPRILRDRMVVLVLGPRGTGKTSVALRLATFFQQSNGHETPAICHLSTTQFREKLVERIAKQKWSDDLLTTPDLLIDGPVWLKNRPATVPALTELIDARLATGLRTFVIQAEDDGSIEALMAVMAVGSLVTIALRFPKGAAGRLRFARRMCDELGLPRSAAKGTEELEPWGYEYVLDVLQLRKTMPASGRRSTLDSHP
jgi:hypothetical protein